MGEEPSDKEEGTLCFLAKPEVSAEPWLRIVGGGETVVFYMYSCVYVCIYVYTKNTKDIVLKVLDSLSILTS